MKITLDIDSAGTPLVANAPAVPVLTGAAVDITDGGAAPGGPAADDSGPALNGGEPPAWLIADLARAAAPTETSGDDTDGGSGPA